MTEEDISVKSHHIRAELCTSRSKYREGRKLKAVKVYTVNQESKYLLVQGVPSVGAQEDLVKLFATYGIIDDFQVLHEYPSEEFTEVYWIKYEDIKNARTAKRKLDDHSFFGGVLHVCYAPEYESVLDTKEKLQERRKAIARRLKSLGDQSGNSMVSSEQFSGRHHHSNQTDVSKMATANSTERRFPETASTPHSSPVMTASELKLTPRVPLHGTPDYAKPPPWTPRPPTMSLPPSALHPTVPPPHCYPHQNFAKYPSASGCNLDDSNNMEGPSTQNSALSSHDSQSYGGHCVTQSSKLTSTNQKSNQKSTAMKETLIIKEYQVKKSSVPKFVPRQLAKPGKRHLSMLHQTRDNVNMELKRNALVLEKEKGPSLPKEDQVRHEIFKKHEMGDASLDKTMYGVRGKLSQVSDETLPPTKKHRTG